MSMAQDFEARFGNSAVVAAVEYWQSLSYIQPFYCDTDCAHGLLVPDGKPTKLLCLKCGYTQTDIPDEVIMKFVHACHGVYEFALMHGDHA